MSRRTVGDSTPLEYCWFIYKIGGKPIIRDMRISVELILSLLAQGVSHGAILDDYPDLESEDIRACNAYAHAVIAGDTLAAVSVRNT